MSHELRARGSAPQRVATAAATAETVVSRKKKATLLCPEGSR